MERKFKKKDSIFVNSDHAAYMSHKLLKQRLKSDKETIQDLNRRMARLEELLLNKS